MHEHMLRKVRNLSHLVGEISTLLPGQGPCTHAHRSCIEHTSGSGFLTEEVSYVLTGKRAIYHGRNS